MHSSSCIYIPTSSCIGHLLRVTYCHPVSTTMVPCNLLLSLHTRALLLLLHVCVCVFQVHRLRVNQQEQQLQQQQRMLPLMQLQAQQTVVVVQQQQQQAASRSPLAVFLGCQRLVRVAARGTAASLPCLQEGLSTLCCKSCNRSRKVNNNNDTQCLGASDRPSKHLSSYGRGVGRFCVQLGLPTGTTT